MQNIQSQSESVGVKGVLSRLRTSTAGNVGYIFAGMLFPMIAMIGSGVDLGRAYMTKTRLQAACDAGALAGRRAMTNLTFDTVSQAKAQKMFDYNFKPAEYSASGTTFTMTADTQGKVSGTAETKMNTLLMKVFNYNQMTLKAACTADLQVPNIDTVLVLDVTGSMAECPNGSNCGGGAGSKIEGLRTAVGSFYTTLKNATASFPNTQIRYGFVPYSQTVNGKEMFKSSPDAARGELGLTHMVTDWSYQSRIAKFNTAVTTTTGAGLAVQQGSPVITEETYSKTGNGAGTPMSYNDCTDYAVNNRRFSIDDGVDSGTIWNPSDLTGNPIFLMNGSFTTLEPTSGTYSRIDYIKLSPTSGWNQTNDDQYYRTCKRQKTVTTFKRDVPSTTEYKFDGWTYMPVSYNVTSLLNGNSVNIVSDINVDDARVPTAGNWDIFTLRTLANQKGFTSKTFSWKGCLEERDTVAATSFSPIPSGAKDLDVLSGGTSDSMRWRPILHEVTYGRPGPAEVVLDEFSGTSYGAADPDRCPSAPMRNLNKMTQTEINAYLPLLQPTGNTYHDIGMVWGIRLLTPNGMFASRNALGANGGQISRNIIFMTDGILVPTTSGYSSYGIENIDQRIAGGSGSVDSRHAARFQALCNKARAEKISVWVIAFGTAMTSNLTACADAGRAFTATNTAELQARFTTIASEIADLRLTK